jgi:hypothetical protein
MKKLALAAALAALSTPVFAGPIEKACLSSSRPGVTRGLCGCIQQAADLTLNGREQRQAAKFFRDPDTAQLVRQSDRQSDEQFWRRYKNFGATAAAYCG